MGVDMGLLLTVTLETAMLAATIAIACTVLDKGPFWIRKVLFQWSKILQQSHLDLTFTPAV